MNFWEVTRHFGSFFGLILVPNHHITGSCAAVQHCLAIMTCTYTENHCVTIVAICQKIDVTGKNGCYWENLTFGGVTEPETSTTNM